MNLGSSFPRTYLAPEVIQTSAMDCGPAALKSLLEGCRIPVSYPRLREACQTDVDGTSIDTMEEVAGLLGLDVEQIMVPLDHLLLAESEALPALVVVRTPSGVTHFVVAWRRHGPLIQLMDPGRGRRFVAAGRFLDDVYLHRMPVDAAAWREWAGSESAAAALCARMGALGIGRSHADTLLDRATRDPSWRSLAELDAGVRMIAALARARAIEPGRRVRALLDGLVASPDSIAEPCWSVRPVSTSDVDGEEQLLLRGAVLVRVTGRTTSEAEGRDGAPLPPDLVAAVNEPRERPGQTLLQLLRADGLLAPAALAAALVVAAGALVLEATLFRGFLDLGRELVRPTQRAAAMAAFLAFAGALLLVELGVARGVLRAGRRLETRLRAALVEKIPLMFDRYFRSRLTSDLAERSHAAQTLRQIPDLGSRVVRSSADLVCTTIAIIWINPGGAPLALLALCLSLGVPLALQPLLIERDMRLRTHTGALTRFYFDALRGLVPIRTHVAERAVRRAHDSLLSEWAQAGRRVLGAVVWIEAFSTLSGLAIAIWLIVAQLSGTASMGGVLLLAYWSLNLPFHGQEIALAAREMARQRNITLRLDELLSAPQVALDRAEESGQGVRATDEPAPAQPGVSIALEGITVRAGGHTVLDGVDLVIPAGCHLGIVGPSGAGKSTLVGLLLGWHQATEGRVLVDGLPLDEARISTLRGATAWVDPSVHIWNRSLLDNLRDGGSRDVEGLDEVLDHALLRGVLKQLPDGLLTSMGEGGARLSGGEGQRVRLGRAMMRHAIRLAILDEAFTGLDRDQRRRLLRHTRARWKAATMLLVTHDVGDTLDLDRVIVVQDGRIVEDGLPREMAAAPGSRYSQLLAAEEMVRGGLWSSEEWRRLRIEGGVLIERREPT